MAALLGVYAWSTQWTLIWYAPRDITLDIAKGTLRVSWFEGFGASGLHVRRLPGLNLWFLVSRGLNAWVVRVPLWVFLPPLAAGAWVSWRRALPAASLCGACGYDLTGIATGVCPECGAQRAVG